MKYKIPVLDISYLSKNKDYDAKNKDFQLIRINDFRLADFAKRLNCYQIIICVKGWVKVRVQRRELRIHSQFYCGIFADHHL